VTAETAEVPFVDLAAQYSSIREEIDEAISRVLSDTGFILGRDLSLFEEEFAAYCGAENAVGVDSGTSALELALRAYGVGPGDQVITVANTFIATVLAISYTGATPVLVDIDPQTYTMDPDLFQAAITTQTRAVIPVHLYGQPADMDAILEIARCHRLVVIEDACQAHGARYKGRRVGSLGDAAAFSFYPAKNLGAYGDGGMVVSDDQEVASFVRMARNYGQSEKHKHVFIGFNRRLDTLQAAALRVKLKHLDAWNAARRRHSQGYGELLADGPVVLPTEADYAESVYHLYVVRASDRDRLQRSLDERGISTGIHYPVPVHLQPAYRDLGYERGSFPVTEECAGQILSLPMYAELTAKAMEYVAQTIKAAVPEWQRERLAG